jgi:creatinine amidohydrolase
MPDEHSSWVEVEAYLRSSTLPIAILPVGSVEAHGPHLPLTTDSIIAEAIAREIGKRLDAFVLPVFHYGTLWSLKDFPGSTWIERDTLTRAIYEIGAVLATHGFKMFVVINAHIGNTDSIKEGLRKLIKDYPELNVYMFNPDLIFEVAKKYIDSKPWYKMYYHAEEIETSLLLYLVPDTVKMDKAVREYPDVPANMDYKFIPWKLLTKSGVIGDPTVANREKGEKIFKEVVSRIVEALEKEIRALTTRSSEAPREPA